MILCLRERLPLPRCIELRFFTGTLRDWFRNKLAGGLKKTLIVPVVIVRHLLFTMHSYCTEVVECEKYFMRVD